MLRWYIHKIKNKIKAPKKIVKDSLQVNKGLELSTNILKLVI